MNSQNFDPEYDRLTEIIRYLCTKVYYAPTNYYPKELVDILNEFTPDWDSDFYD